MSVSDLESMFYGLRVRDIDVDVDTMMRASGARAQQLRAWLPLPLTSVHVSVRTFDFCSEVSVTQSYCNNTCSILDSEFVFPLDDNSSVSSFVAEIDGRIIHGDLREKAEAKRTFDHAKASGHTAMLMEQSKENVFKVSIGNFAPNTVCKVVITYICTLDMQGNANRIVIPAVVAPKYQPQQYYGYRAPSVGVVPADSISIVDAVGVNANGELTDVVAVSQQLAQSHRFTMQIDVAMPSSILKIESESHPNDIRVHIAPIDDVAALMVDDESSTASASSSSSSSVPARLPLHRATITFGMQDGGATSLESRDFSLTITQSVSLEARAVLEVDPITGSRAIQLAFCPTELEMMDAASLQTEIIFLIDQSGSMEGAAIASVKSLLLIFLKSLPISCKFNLVSFGSTYILLFPDGADYSEESIAMALAYVDNIKAELGGTEIMEPLRYCFETAGDAANYPRQIFLLTDGQVTNTQQLIDLTKQYSHAHRLFAFGLGSSVDRHLVKSLASAGGGECEFITARGVDGQQELNGAVMRNLIRAMQPSLSDVRIDWTGKGDDSAAHSYLQCPQTIAPIFPPTRRVVYAMLDESAPTIASSSSSSSSASDQSASKIAAADSASSSSAGDDIINIRVSAISNRPGSNRNASTGRVEFVIPLNMSRPQSGSFIHQLAARERIDEIQNSSSSDSIKKSAVLSLALKYKLLSNYTSFVIVDDRVVVNRLSGDNQNDDTSFAECDNDESIFASNASSGAAHHSAAAAVSSSAQQQPVRCMSRRHYRHQSSDDDIDADALASIQSALNSQTQNYSPRSMRTQNFIDQLSQVQYNRVAPNIDLTSSSAASPQMSSLASPHSLSLPGDDPQSVPCSVPSSPLLSSCLSDSMPSCMPSSMPSSNAPSMPPSPLPQNGDADSPSARALSQVHQLRAAHNIDSTSSSAAASHHMSSYAAYNDDDQYESYAAPTITSTKDALTPLVALSSFDGSFALTIELIAIIVAASIGTQHSSLVASFNVESLTSRAASLSLSPTCVGTLIAIWALRTLFASRKSEWSMLEAKARSVMRSKMGIVDANQIDENIALIIGVQ